MQKETAGQGLDFASALQPKSPERMTVLIVLDPGKIPEITFTGDWSGKFIQAAQKALAKAYRQRRFKPRGTEPKGEHDGDKS